MPVLYNFVYIVYSYAKQQEDKVSTQKTEIDDLKKTIEDLREKLSGKDSEIDGLKCELADWKCEVAALRLTNNIVCHYILHAYINIYRESVKGKQTLIEYQKEDVEYHRTRKPVSQLNLSCFIFYINIYRKPLARSQVGDS